MNESQMIAAAKAAAETLNKRYAAQFPGLAEHTEIGLRLEHGKVYTRLVCFDINRADKTERGGHAWGFIKNDDLTLWKAAGWKAPAKNKARGELADLYNVQKVNDWCYGIQ